MSIEQAFHDRWKTDARITALVPIERVFTGTAVGAAPLPYVAVARSATAPVAHASGGTLIEKTRLEVGIWSADLDTGKQIAAEAARLYERADFAMTGGGVLNVQPAGRREKPQSDGAWLVALDLDVITTNQSP